MQPTSIEDLCQSIEHLIHEHLQACRAEVSATIERTFQSASRTKRQAKATQTQTRESGPRRTEAELMAIAERFYDLLCKQPGEKMVALAAQLELTPRELHRPVTRLKRAKLVRTVGQRGHTRYYPIIDGKTIRARA